MCVVLRSKAIRIQTLTIKPFFTDLLRAFKLVWEADKRLAIVNALLQAVQAFLPVSSLYYMKVLIEEITHQAHNFESILPPILMYGCIQIFTAALGQYASYLSTKHQHRLVDHLSREVLEQAIKVDYEYYENPVYHDTMHLAQQQAISKATQLLNNINTLILNILSLVFMVGFFFTLHSWFAIFFILLAVPLAAVKWYSGYALLKLDKKFVPLEREASYLHMTLTGINPAKEVRVFGYGEAFIEKFRNIRKLIYHEKTKLYARLTWYSLFAEAGEVVVMCIVLVVLARYTWQRVITIGAFVIYIQGFQRLQSSSKSFLQAVVQLFQQRLFLKDLFAFLDLKTGNAVSGTAPFTMDDTGLIVNNLNFNYPGIDRQILHNVSLQCKPGSIIAVVGENGSGKSTLVKLIARLYASDDIRIGNTNLMNIELKDFRDKSVFLFQDFERYFLSVEENITLGDFNEQKDSDAIRSAAILADADTFISKMSMGYKTRIGRMFKGSEQLSGGQWQKLALSRIFYRKAKLIVLDEPTSALDPIAEAEVFSNIRKNLKDQMVILITHRLYNLKIADHIYVFKDGRIVQEGNYPTLITEEGEFNTMFKNQRS